MALRMFDFVECRIDDFCDRTVQLGISSIALPWLQFENPTLAKYSGNELFVFARPLRKLQSAYLEALSHY